MKIELKLWEDQGEAKHDDINSTTWELFVGGQPFPSNDCNLCNLTEAHEIANVLVDIEERLSE